MDLPQRKKQLVQEFNVSQQNMTRFQQQISQLANQQVRIQGQLQLIDELEKEQKEKQQVSQTKGQKKEKEKK